jgi:uncharacterized protein
MKKIALEIVGLQPSMTQSHNYAVVLGERYGKRRLPIIIGGFEAQAIAVAVERMLPNRPLTHDLFKSTLDTFSIELKEIIITNLLDGVFYAKLVCDREGVSVEIDSRTSDALAMAVRYTCPIFTYEFILEAAGVVLEDSEGANAEDIRLTSPVSKSSGSKGTRASDEKSPLSGKSLEELTRMLEEVLNNEDYEQAAHIRDELNKRK